VVFLSQLQNVIKICFDFAAVWLIRATTKTTMAAL